MKKNSKRKLKDYSKYDETRYEYYGLLYKRGRARIDVKRMNKTLKLDSDMLKVMNKPRKTVYFIPEKIHRDDYSVNIFRDTIQSLIKNWNREYSKALKSIKTPEQARDEATTGHFLQTGTLEPDELQTYGSWEMLKRESVYNYIKISMIAQYIHQIASTIEATIVSVITKHGYKNESFNRNDLRVFISKDNKYDLDDFEHYSAFDELYTIWNFLKHNSIDTFNKTNKKFPHLLYQNQDYKSGNLAIGYLRLNVVYINDLLKRLIPFFEELCEKGLGENVRHSNWNYDDFFKSLVSEEIKHITNPYGFPPTL